MRHLLATTALFFVATCILSPLARAQDDGPPVTGFGFTSLGSAEGMNATLEAQKQKMPVVAAYVSRLCELSDEETSKLNACVDKAFEEWKAKYLVLRDRLAKVQAEYKTARSQQEPMEDLEKTLDQVYEDRAKLSLFTSSEALNSAVKQSLSKADFQKYTLEIDSRRKRKIANRVQLLVTWIDVQVGLSDQQNEFFKTKIETELGEALAKYEYVFHAFIFEDTSRFTPVIFLDEYELELQSLKQEAGQKKTVGESVLEQLGKKLKPSQQLVFETTCGSVFRSLGRSMSDSDSVETDSGE